MMSPTGQSFSNKNTRRSRKARINEKSPNLNTLITNENGEPTSSGNQRIRLNEDLDFTSSHRDASDN